MNINERIFSTMKRKKVTQEQLANALNTSQSVIAGWKNRGTIPTMEYLPKICKVLEVTWEYIITGKENEEHLTTDEKHLVEQYRKVKPENQKDILDYIEYKIYKQ